MTRIHYPSILIVMMVKLLWVSWNHLLKILLTCECRLTQFTQDMFLVSFKGKSGRKKS